MKKRFTIISLFVMMAVGVSTFTVSPFAFVASATYVEGAIMQDTVWTLTDSPFVVSKNITVYPNVTLTIEPGVEVRFGGEFSLTVEGSLSANGAENNPINFTSNKHQPAAGDWDTIRFRGSELSSLVYCVIEYGKNAITLENGTVRIDNCEIGRNSLNGITIENSFAEVRESKLANNSESGIQIAGSNQVTIQNNTISSNADGILLTGNLTAGVSISQNIVMSNSRSGIQLDADEYSDIEIFDNIVSANSNGFYTSGQASTYITTNSISYNTIGVFYETGKDHSAYYNDIYANEQGMDVSSNATVNAEYNYWGHESGPYHTSLNPAGNGNPVGGDGFNLDFIFFLTAPIGYINSQPTARLFPDKALVPPNHPVTFIATNSSDDRRVNQYFFDFGDGNSSGWTTLSIFTHEYSSVGTYNAGVTVMDDFGVVSNNLATVTINIAAITPLQVSLTTSNSTVDYGTPVSLVVHVTESDHPIQDAEISLFSVVGGSFTNSSGWTNSTGYFKTTFTAPNVTKVTNLRLVASVSKTGYADGSSHEYLKILPPLVVEVVDPTSIQSEETSIITARVTYDGWPVAQASVLMSADKGHLWTGAEFTDENGDARFSFTAPQTLISQNITLEVSASKIEYLEGSCRATITVMPKVLVVRVTAAPSILVSERASDVIVHVTHETHPIPNATVHLCSTGGDLSAQTRITGSNGTASFTFLAPAANKPLEITITANATRAGYVSGEDGEQLIVYPGILDVEVVPHRALVKSGATSLVFVHVKCNEIPVENANVTVSSDAGNFAGSQAITDPDGYCGFNFIAPEVTENLAANITAVAAKDGYRGGKDYAKIEITLESLMIEISPDALVVESEDTTNLTLHVTYEGQPVSDALVTMSSDGDGNFSTPTGITDSNGDCTFSFIAPQTTEQLNVTLAATATKVGYADGEERISIVIHPKVLAVELTADPTVIDSEESSSMTVYVTYAATPISDVNVTLSSNYGNFSQIKGITDSNGSIVFTFIAPQVYQELNVTVKATATKIGYADGEEQIEMTVIPRTLTVQISADPANIESGAVSTVGVRVTYDAGSVVDAVVVLSSDGGGDFSPVEAVTDSNGNAAFVFSAPEAETEFSLTLTATATKTGYLDGEGQMTIIVSPPALAQPGGFGLPLTTIIIIVAVLIVIVVVVLLIKLKIIYISWR